MRGKLLSGTARKQLHGITPAGAGKTLIDKYLLRAYKDHPRRCGENRKGVDKSDTVQGSPPQVRGKLEAECCKKVKYRITPAGAGKTMAECG